jgi:hypothetical protein
MKRLLLLFAVLSTLVVNAAPLCTPTANILNYNGTGGCEVSGMLFSSFVLGTSGAGTIGPQAVITIFESGGVVTFNQNPNQGSALNAQTSTLAFNISVVSGLPAIIGASSANGGTPASTIRQVVCAGTINFATGACTGTLLQDVTNAGGTFTATQAFAAQTAVNVWRQIVTPTGNTVTGASFDFQTSEVPEPWSLMLVGSGLLGMGLARKRVVARKAKGV